MKKTISVNENIFLDLKDLLGIDKEEKKIEKELKLTPNVYKDTLKKLRTIKEKRDFFDKEEMIDLLKKYCALRDSIENNEIESQEELEDLRKMKKILRDTLMEGYIKIARKLLRHTHFKYYSEEFKSDLIGDAVVKALSVGCEGKNNFGKEYFTRFDFDNRDNLFSLWTQQIKNFFYQTINEIYEQNNIKWENLENIVDQFNYDNKNIHDCPSAKFHFDNGKEGDKD